MEHSDILLTLAEIAVAFAGFASLIGLLGRSSSFLDSSRLVGMVRTALIAAAFAVAPLVPHALGISEGTAWRISGASFFAVNGVVTFLSWKVLYRAWKAGLWTMRVGYFTFPMGLAGLALALASCLVASPSLAAGLYLSSLVSLLTISGVLFLGVFTSFVRGRGDPSAAQQAIEPDVE
jgi:hypothetical protein